MFCVLHVSPVTAQNYCALTLIVTCELFVTSVTLVLCSQHPGKIHGKPATRVAACRAPVFDYTLYHSLTRYKAIESS